MSDKITKIVERIAEFAARIRQVQNCLEYDHIELPFNLTDKAIELLAEIFTVASLQQLAENQEEETLNAWAIALTKTLDKEIKLLDQWLTVVNALPVYQKLKDEINDKSTVIKDSVQTKSVLLKLAKIVLNDQQLETFKATIESSPDIHTLEAQIESEKRKVETQVKELESKDKEIQELQQKSDAKKVNLEAKKLELEAKNQEKGKLETQIDDCQVKFDKLANQNQELAQQLAEANRNLEAQKQKYDTIESQRKQAIEDWQKYESATKQIQDALKLHAQSNQEIGGNLLLPSETQSMENLGLEIARLLQQQDEILSVARQKNEELQKKPEQPIRM